VVPSVSPVREKLWSYADLIALRVVSWLRHAKPADVGDLPASPMPQVRQALKMLDEYTLDPWSPSATESSPLLVDYGGLTFLRINGDVIDLHGQRGILNERFLDLTAPFTSAGGAGPNLLRPRPHLRIVPAKVAGEPHIEHSRLTSQTVAALADRGYDPAQIAAMYDDQEHAIREAIDLERQLAGSVVAA
jgi:uncharacterized protein (DUF433 family)